MVSSGNKSLSRAWGHFLPSRQRIRNSGFLHFQNSFRKHVDSNGYLLAIFRPIPRQSWAGRAGRSSRGEMATPNLGEGWEILSRGHLHCPYWLSRGNHPPPLHPWPALAHQTNSGLPSDWRSQEVTFLYCWLQSRTREGDPLEKTIFNSEIPKVKENSQEISCCFRWRLRPLSTH